MREEIIGDCRLILGDCREILPTLGKVDAVVTDPPYGIGFVGKKTKDYPGNKTGYESYEDTPENVAEIILPILERCRGISSRVVLTPGIKNLFRYPPADHVGAIYYPAGAGMNPWGFTCWQPILYYGKDPYGGTGSRPDSFESSESSEKNGHPCPKPIGQMLRLVNRATRSAETILDPFMGSGTTGVACVKLGRKFIGIEIEPKYFDIACKRIEAATKEPRLPLPEPKMKQSSLLEEGR